MKVDFPHPNTVEWPVEFVLSAMSPKHVFSSAKKANIRDVYESVASWRNKLLWRAYFGSAPSNWSSLVARRHKTSRCTEDPCSIAPILDLVGNQVTDAVLRSRVLFRNAPTPPIVLLARLLLRAGPWSAWLTDKDGGFCLVPRSDVKSIQMNSLNDLTTYRVCSLYDSIITSIANSFMSTCRLVANSVCDDDGGKGELSSVLTNDFRSGSASFLARLTHNVKTHKPCVSFRGIHAAPRYAFRSLSMWVSGELRRAMGRCDHLIVNASDLIRKACSRRYSSGAIALKLDIKDFFMEGRHEDLAADALKTKNLSVDNDTSTDEAFRHAVQFLLANQYVTASEAPSESWQVVRCSGMGLPASGELSDASLFQRAEASFALVTAMRQQYGIEFYGWYRDDALVIFGNSLRASRFPWFQKLCHLSSPCKIVVETVSREQVSMLDVLLTFQDDGSLISSHHVKPTSQKTWLSDNSCHHTSVHKTWPLAVVRRIGDLCTMKSARDECRKAFVNSLASQCPDHVALQVCRNTIDRDTPNPPRRNSSARSSWLALKFCVATSRAGVSSILRRYHSLFLANGIPVPRICWSLADKHMFLAVRNDSMPFCSQNSSTQS